jgi:DNA repair protein RadD
VYVNREAVDHPSYADVDKVYADIVSVILGRGAMSKAEIVDTWGLDSEQYDYLKSKLQKERLLEIGSKGVGGFRAHFAKRAQKPESEETAKFFTTDWENAATDRLRELLSHEELENLLGNLIYTVRKARIEMTGEDRRGTKSELAAALVIQHGIDLFYDADVRKLISKKCRAKYLKRWHPGKATAIAFSKAVDFPVEFAGLPTEDLRPDFEYLEGRIDLRPLERFQKEVQDKVVEVLRKASGRAIVTLPTGAGKTRVAVDSIRDWLTEQWEGDGQGLGKTVLWLAHTEELCEQAYECFKQVWQASTAVCPLWLFRFWGRYTQDLKAHQETLANIRSHPSIIISTPQRIVNLTNEKISGGKTLLGDLKETAGLILIDEAHRAAAPTYRKILSEFTHKAGITVVGLTATPFRGEYANRDPEAGVRELRELFKQIVEPIRTLGEDVRSTLQENGFLAKPEWETVKTKTLLKAPEIPDIDNITVEDIDRIDHALKIRADNPNRRMAILDYITPICEQPDSLILYFGPSVLDAECMAFLLRQKGIPAAFVSGSTRDVTRRGVVNDFKNQKIKVLCNCEVLTTGFDAPKVTHVVMARPTVSQVLYEQMLGRGLRGPKFGGTETCVIIDCEDNYRSDRPMLGYQAFRKGWGGRMPRSNAVR